MYQITCDGYILYDPRDDELILLNPKCKLEVNTVCEGSFTILPTHPYYHKLQKLKSIFEIKQNNSVIFRGRMTEDSRDFNNMLDVDLEGVLSFANDSTIPPFDFPAEFPEAEDAENMVEYFLNWVLTQHNNQVEDWQQLKLGKVTVKDPNNYIIRSHTDYSSTWDTLKSKLFDSALGGYLICRYEADGNYIDYLSEFELTNTQKITLGENLLDISIESDATETYSAILPIGAEVENKDGTKTRLTLSSLADGNISDDLVKKGRFIYSKSAVKENGWRCVPVSESKWDDVTNVSNLRSKAIEYLQGTAILLSSTISIKAVDLGFSDEEIQSFRYGRNVLADIPTHGITDKSYPLPKLDIDILSPQNTGITLGETVRTLTDINDKVQTASALAQMRAEQAAADAKIAQETAQKAIKEATVNLRIDSSRGTVFKNNEVSTVLSAVIYKGTKRITDITALREEFGNSAYLEWHWQRMNENSFGTILSTDSRIGDDGFTFTLSPEDVNTKVVFMCQLITD